MKKVIIGILILIFSVVLELPAQSESADFTAVDRHADNTPAGFTVNVKTLTQYLVKSARTEKEKARVIFRWISKNIRYHLAGYLREEARDSSAETVLKKRKGVCSGYANLYAAMAKVAGLNVKIIYGDAKMPMSFKPNAPETEGHAWNAVEIDSKWHLLDATGGGASHWNGQLRPIAEIIMNHYFLIPPEKLIYSHFPKDSEWQRLPQPITREQFLKLPNLFFGYWNHNVELVNPLYDIRETGNRLKVTLKAPDNLVMYGVLLRGNTLLNRNASVNMQQLLKYSTVFIHKEGGAYTVHAAFPDKGLYYLVVVARKKNEPQTFMQPVILYKVKAKSGANVSFPVVVPQFYEENVVLVNPIESNFRANSLVRFTLKSNTASEMVIYGGGLYASFKKNGNTFEGNFKIPKGEFYIMAKFPAEGQVKPLLIYNGRY